VPAPDTTRLAIPDPSLVVLVGAAGAGKSTFIGRWFRADEVLSSDALRGRIAGDERDQRVTRVAFSILHRAVVRRLAGGRLTVVDATNVRAHARRALIARARAAGVPIVAIVLDLPDAVVHARNAARTERVVDPEVVAAQLADLRHSRSPGRLDSEGFDVVHRIRSERQLEGISIVRMTS
jgi:protein phosphatase